MSNLRRPVIIQVVYGVDVSPPTSMYLLSMSTCELTYVDVCSFNVYLWTYLHQRMFFQCLLVSSNASTYVYLLECITSTYIAIVSTYILLIPCRVSTYLSCTSTCIIHFYICAGVCKNQVDVYPMITLTVSTYLLHTSTYIQWLCIMCRRCWFLCWL